jgi:hypothetical protein
MSSLSPYNEVDWLIELAFEPFLCLHEMRERVCRVV